MQRGFARQDVVLWVGAEWLGKVRGFLAAYVIVHGGGSKQVMQLTPVAYHGEDAAGDWSWFHCFVILAD